MHNDRTRSYRLLYGVDRIVCWASSEWNLMPSQGRRVCRLVVDTVRSHEEDRPILASTPSRPSVPSIKHTTQYYVTKYPVCSAPRPINGAAWIVCGLVKANMHPPQN